MERRDIIQEINDLAFCGTFDEEAFDFDDQEYIVTVCGFECGSTMVDVSYFPDFDGYVDIEMFNNEFLRALYRAICDKAKLTDKNLF